MRSSAAFLFPALALPSVLLVVVLARVAADEPRPAALRAPAAEKARRLPGKEAAFEPTVALGTEGRVVVAAAQLGDPKVAQRSLIVWRSEDNGHSWLAPSYLPELRDVGTIQSDPWLQSVGPGRVAIAYIAWTSETPNRPAAVFQRSEDGGKTWAAPHVLHRWVDKTVMAISPSGKHLVVAFRTSDSEKGPGVQAHRSSDQGKNWQELSATFAKKWPYIAQGIIVTDQGAIAIGWEVQAGGSSNPRLRRVVTSTTDDGKHWEEKELAAAPGADLTKHFLKGPALALDEAGRVHSLWVGRDGKGEDVLLRSSKDFRTWSEPLVLAEGPHADWRGFPALATGSGRLHAAWMERKDERYQVWYRGSADGGATWSERVLLSRPENSSDLLTVEGFVGTTGHYMSLADDGQGAVHAVWDVGQPGGAGKARGEIWHNVIRWRSVGKTGSP
jgi:hypothetical protein